jgi:hypothetical protein
MRLPRFTTLQLGLITTLAALLAGLFTCAWKWRPVWVLAAVVHPEPAIQIFSDPYELTVEHRFYTDAISAKTRLAPMAAFVVGFVAWAAVWGVVRKRRRESLAKKSVAESEDCPRQRLPTPSSLPCASPPLALKSCWGLMIVGGIVALGIPIVLMFLFGPLLFPTVYFSLFVGLAAIARGAARDSVGLKRTAGLQLANMIALDVANVIFAAMEFALLRSRSVRDYLAAQNR